MSNAACRRHPSQRSQRATARGPGAGCSPDGMDSFECDCRHAVQHAACIGPASPTIVHIAGMRQPTPSPQTLTCACSGGSRHSFETNAETCRSLWAELLEFQEYFLQLHCAGVGSALWQSSAHGIRPESPCFATCVRRCVMRVRAPPLHMLRRHVIKAAVSSRGQSSWRHTRRPWTSGCRCCTTPAS